MSKKSRAADSVHTAKEETVDGEVPKKAQRRGNDRKHRKTEGASNGEAFYAAKLKKGPVARQVPKARPSVGFAGRCVLNPGGQALGGSHRRS